MFKVGIKFLLLNQSEYLWLIFYERKATNKKETAIFSNFAVNLQLEIPNIINKRRLNASKAERQWPPNQNVCADYAIPINFLGV